MSRLVDAPGLAAVLAESDPFRPSTEVKLEQVKNLLVAFDNIGPAFCYGGVHRAVLQLYLGCNWEWESTNNLALEVLRLLLEGCTTTPEGLDPFDVEGLVEIAAVLGDTISDVLEAGMKEKFGAAVHHSLEALFSITRYFGNPKSEAIKCRLWEPEVDLPSSLIELAQLPMAAWGHDASQDQGGVLYRNEPLERYLSSCNNIVRVTNSLLQMGSAADFTATLMKHGELMKRPDIYAAFRELLQVGCDVLYTRRYRELVGDTPEYKASGAAMIRNIFSMIGHGAYWAGARAIADWRDAGWEPVLQRIKSDRTYRGPYHRYFGQMSSYLLEALPAFRGADGDAFGGEAFRFGEKLMEITLQLSRPAGSPASLPLDRPRDPSSLVENHLRRPTGQAIGPDGEPVNTFEVQTTVRTYQKRCAKCGKDEAQLAQEAAAAAAAGAASGGAADGGQEALGAGAPKLRNCAKCRRACYCSRECQVEHWDSTLTARNETGCGELNAVCCQLQINPNVIQDVCNTKELYCTYEGSTSRCAPVPAGCGEEGADCCPGATPYCRAPNTACLPTNMSAAADNQPDIPTKCIQMLPESCGQPNGLCQGSQTSWPDGPVPACPADKQICPAGYYCFRVFEDRVGVCLQPPPNCGQQDARCCPPGIYGPPGSPRNVTGFSCEGKDIKCAGWGGMPGAGVCTFWPSPPDCGLPGKKCCLDPYHNWMDSSEPPPVCDRIPCHIHQQGGPKGSYCQGEYNNGTCVENPADCGQLGKACCRSLSELKRAQGLRSGYTVPGGCCSSYKCDAGLYCPFMDEREPACKTWLSDPAFAAWEDALSLLPKYAVAAVQGELRAWLRGLPPFPLEALLPPGSSNGSSRNSAGSASDNSSSSSRSSTQPFHGSSSAELWRAYLLLSFLAHGYMWCDGPDVPPLLPARLAAPCTYNLLNWQRLDPAGPVQLGNIACLHNFLGGLDEEWFRLVHIQIEQQAAGAVAGLPAAQAAAAAGDGDGVRSAVELVTSALIAMQATLSRMGEKCDPAIYYQRVRLPMSGWRNNPELPGGLVYEGLFGGQPQQFYGETGAQSAILHALDAALGIRHDQCSWLAAYLRDMRQHMPPAHRAFVAQLEAGTSLRSAVEGAPGNRALRDAYNECVHELERFRSQHKAFAFNYIAKHSKKADETGTGGSDFMPALQGYRDATARHRLP
ncbi:hypothetical protein COHA_003286 [Chlorella ohadii]|uniref:MYND-type domain-containing protein n=1 Tax=Chlorella ohadii TaxID=2649997 RepID=A0AAD5DSG5_9CHLO|nr:hypothetical protein COHA_003286 [Chlorella ohadii]